jgi:hypothetical protein
MYALKTYEPEKQTQRRDREHGPLRAVPGGLLPAVILERGDSTC